MKKYSLIDDAAILLKERFARLAQRLNPADSLKWEELPEEDRADLAALMIVDESDKDKDLEKLPVPEFSLEIIPDNNGRLQLHFLYCFKVPLKSRAENFAAVPVDFKFAVLNDIPLFMISSGTPTFIRDWDIVTGFKTLYGMDNRDVFSMQIDPVISVHFIDQDPARQDQKKELQISDAMAEAISKAIQNAARELDEAIRKSSFDNAAFELENRTAMLFYKMPYEKVIKAADRQMKEIEKRAKI